MVEKAKKGKKAAARPADTEGHAAVGHKAATTKGKKDASKT